LKYSWSLIPKLKKFVAENKWIDKFGDFKYSNKAAIYLNARSVTYPHMVVEEFI
jgi:hypothetical protein